MLEIVSLTPNSLMSPEHPDPLLLLVSRPALLSGQPTLLSPEFLHASTEILLVGVVIAGGVDCEILEAHVQTD